MTCDLYRLRIHPVCKHSHTLRRWGSGLWGHRSAQSSLSRTRLTVASATLSGFAPKQSSTHARSAWARTDPRGQAHAWGRGQAGPKAAVRCPCPGGSSPSQRGRQWGEGALLPEGTEGHLGAGRGWVPPSAHALGLDPSWVRSCEGTWLRCRAESSPNKRHSARRKHDGGEARARLESPAAPPSASGVASHPRAPPPRPGRPPVPPRAPRLLLLGPGSPPGWRRSPLGAWVGQRAACGLWSPGAE